LQSGHLRAAGLDVFAREPLPADSPLLALDNVVLMPHVAWLTPETLDRSLDVAVDHMRRLRDRAELQFRVVREVVVSSAVEREVRHGSRNRQR
jgi:phosphoglycerate dehydrogenase-like enzyme